MRLLKLMMLTLALSVAGCVAPSPQEAEAQATGVAKPAHPGTSTPIAASPKPGQPIKMPPKSDPLPPERVQAPAGTAVQIDRSCQVDSDCAVKDVGSCCGHSPACVHKDSPTDPAGVRAQCARDGIASVCGFNEITACRCVRNECVGEQEPVGGWMDDPPAPPPADR